MTDEELTAVLEILRELEADLAAMRAGIRALNTILDRIEPRLDGLDERVRRIAHRLDIVADLE